MEFNQFQNILEQHIVPMFTGATLTNRMESPAWKKRRAFLVNQSKMIVRYPRINNRSLLLSRSQQFLQSDAAFVQTFVDHLAELDPVSDSAFIVDLINPILRRTVAYQVAHSAESFVSEMLAQFEKWAEQTYEGRKIAAAIGVDTAAAGSQGVRILKIFSKPFGAVLANGLDSFLTSDQEGHLVAYTAPTNLSAAPSLMAPLRFSHLAEWSDGQKIGLALNRNGEIAVFAKKSLVFAKRRGNWHHFTFDAIIKRISLVNCFPNALCKAVYQSCLDVSFAKTGGGIAIIRRTQLPAFENAGIVADNDWTRSRTTKGRTLTTLVSGQPFQNLDRRLRQDIVAMDGATILDYQGHILAAGAIVKVKAGSEGGGRLAASKALSKFGLGIKISSDGGIRAFKRQGARTREIFTIG